MIQRLLLLSVLLFSCTTQNKTTQGKSVVAPAASTQAATPASNKAPRALAHISLGVTAQTLDQLSAKIPWVINSRQLTNSIARELQDAAAEIDLMKGSEALLGFSPDHPGFVNFSFALKKEHRIKEKLKTTPDLDTKGHQYAIHPLPGSPLSPFNRVLYIDVKDDRLWISDQPDGLKLLPLQSGLVTPTLRATIDFASLWYVFGVPYQDAYIAQKQTESFQATSDTPKAKQEAVVWESFFRLADSMYQIELEAETGDGILLSLLVSTKQKLDAKIEPIKEEPYQIMPGAQFGVRAQLPKVVLKTLAELRKRLAPPAFDSLAMFYPLANAMSGSLFFGGGIDSDGFWSVGQYSLSDSAVARLALQRYFTEVPRKDANFLEVGRTFVFQESKAKTASGAHLDFVDAKLEAPEAVDKVLGIHNIQTRYEISPNQALTTTGKSALKKSALLGKEVSKLPQPLVSLLEKKSNARPSTEPLPSPFLLFWYSPEAVENLNDAPATVAATLAQQGERFLLRIALLP
jgi:hypothetical protein